MEEQKQEEVKSAGAETIFLKLGPKAASYVNPTNLFAISGPEVIKIDKNLLIANASAKNAVANKHLVEATQEEYDAYQESSKEGTEPKTHFEALGDRFKAIPGAGDPAQSFTLEPTDQEGPKSSPNLGLGKSGLPGPGAGVLQNKEAGDGAETIISNKQTEIPESQTGQAAGNTTAKASGDIKDTEDEDDELTQSEMIDELKGNTKVPEAEKAGLTKLSLANLKKAHAKYTK